MTTERKVAVVVGVLLIGFLAIFWGKMFGPGYTRPITDNDGEVIPTSVASLETINLGGFKQSILIRGHDPDNPVLLWLHGGPGDAQMPIAHHLDKELEKEFTVIHWDQRGAGKSNPSDFDEATMSYDQFISDAHQLTEYLQERFAKEKIYLLGHSWGAQLGLELAGRYPEDYYAYIGVGQVTNAALHNRISYDWLIRQIKAKDAKADLEKLEGLGPPPFTDHETYVTFIQLVGKYGGSFDVSFSQLFWIAVQSTEYTLADYLAWLRGANRGSGPMWEEEAYLSFDAAKRFPKLEIPVYFFTGTNDFNTPLDALRQYYENLEAPRGKELLVFENSAHLPFMSEREKFVRAVIRVKRETL